MHALVLLALAASPDVNLLTLEAGAVAVEASDSYGGDWTVDGLVDGNPRTGWCSPMGARGPWTFVFELEQRSALVEVEVDNTNAQEREYPGISASGLEVWVSSNRADGFTQVTSLKLPKGGRARVPLAEAPFGRFVKLVVTGNHGATNFTELMEVSVKGHPLEPPGPPMRHASGTWDLSGGGVLRLVVDDDAQVRGCVVLGADAWRLRGAMAGRVARVSLDAPEGPPEAGTVVVASSGAVLRWARREPSAVVVGTRRPEGPDADCAALMDQAALERRLAGAPDGIVLRGVGFGANDEPRLEPGAELAPLAGLLAARPQLKVRMLVLGKTTEPANDELKRCERRARAVLAALMKLGVPPESVVLGYGLLKVGPVQPEPRVEVRLER